METTRQLTTRVRNATAGVLPAGLPVVVAARKDGAVPTFDITVRTRAGKHRFSGGWAGKGWPTDVERLVGMAPDIEVVFARNLSQGAREWLAAQRLGWVDEAGRANINLSSGLVVSREARDVPAERPVPDGWTRTMLAAAEAALAGVPPTVEAIQAATGMSRGAATNALASLERKGLVERPKARRGPGSARRIVSVDSLVDEYAAAAGTFRAKQPVVLVHRLWTDPLATFAAEIAPLLSSEGVRWAVTGAAASTLLAPYLGDVTIVELYVAGELFADRDRLATILGGRIVERGHRIEVRELPTSMSATGPEVGGIRVALPARVYADLLAAGGRSEEAAHHLRETMNVGPST
jgi:DNA-binding transcriptional ArsR family regulator